MLKWLVNFVPIVYVEVFRYIIQSANSSINITAEVVGVTGQKVLIETDTDVE